MTAKEQKFLTLFAEAARCRLPEDEKEFLSAMSGLAAFDVSSALLAWEYFLATLDGEAAKSPALAAVITDGTERVIAAKSQQRLIKAITDSAVIRAGIYRRSPTAMSRAETAAYAAQVLLSGKSEEGDDIMRCAMKNASGNFGPFMAAVVDRLIVELVRKNPAKPSFPKKLSAQILAFSDKIKGPEKAFIAQRIREL